MMFEGAAECFLSDKTRTAGNLNGFKNDPFYTNLVGIQIFNMISILAQKFKDTCLKPYYKIKNNMFS